MDGVTDDIGAAFLALGSLGHAGIMASRGTNKRGGEMKLSVGTIKTLTAMLNMVGGVAGTCGCIGS